MIASVLTYAFVVLILAAGTGVTLALIQATPADRSPTAADNKSVASLVSEAPRTHALGDAVIVGDAGAQIRITLDNLRTGAEGADCSGGSIHLVDATIQSLRGKAVVEPAKLTARSSGGQETPSVSTELEHPLRTTTLTENTVITGSVAFVLPPGQTIVALSFTGASQSATWAVPSDTDGAVEP
jgi:hypothetical protein